MKDRLDALLVARGLCASRQLAQAHVICGRVTVNGRPCVKPGTRVPADADVSLAAAAQPFVSRGGEKLAGALDAFRLDAAGLDALDVGASTGGFTDCLLQRGTRSVTALDVGRAQLHPALRSDSRVTVIERFNFRRAAPADFPHPFHIITIDVSFISLAHILPPAARLLHAGGRLLALVKPQFEVGKGKVGKGGVVRDPEMHRGTLLAAARHGMTAGLHPAAVAPSVLKGPKGNVEFFILFSDVAPAPDFDLAAAVDAAVRAAHAGTEFRGHGISGT